MEYATRAPIERIVLGRKPARILDYGGGQGNLVIPFAKHGHDVVLVDIDPEYVEHVRAQGITSHTGAEDALDRLEGGFDMVVMNHVIEHIQCPHESTLPRLFNLLKPGGRILVSTPNTAKVYNRLALLAGKFGDGIVYQHVRFYTHETLDQELRRVGFRRVATYPDGYTRLTRTLAKVKPSLGDEICVEYERPHDAPDAPVDVRTWRHHYEIRNPVPHSESP